MKILDGKALANIKSKEIIERVKSLDITPSLVIILVGDNFASKIYVNHKIKKAKELGISAKLLNLPSTITQDDLIKTINILNADKKVHGYLVQLPLPKHIDSGVIQEHIDPNKDVDGLSSANAGKLFQNSNDYVVPATPKGIIEILKYYDIKLAGKIVAVLGRSNIVGKPISLELLKLNATIIMCHSKTDLAILKTADIIISSTGVANLIKDNMIKKGSTIIDVGINRDKNNKLTGDVDFNSVKNKVFAITPVPGGVGPMTIISIFENLLELMSK